MSRSAACELWLQILLTVLGCCTAWWLAGWKASAVLLLTAAALLLTGAVFRRRNNRTLVRLSDEIGQVLHGADQITFSDYDEGTVIEHLKRAIDFTMHHLGAHGMPAGLHADWNDCLKLGAQGESS